MSNITFTMIKPDAVADGHAGSILEAIVKGGFKPLALKMLYINKREASAFYSIHSERSFFGELVDYMTSGPVVAAVLEADDAVSAYRKYIGSTNPSEAAEGTIRNRFGKNIQSNAVHGSDSDENARREALFFFAEREWLQD